MSHVTTKSNTHMKIKDFSVQIYCTKNPNILLVLIMNQLVCSILQKCLLTWLGTALVSADKLN